MTIDKVALPLLLLILKRQLIHRHIAARRMRQKLISGRSVIPCGTSNTRADEHRNSRARSRERERFDSTYCKHHSDPNRNQNDSDELGLGFDGIWQHEHESECDRSCTNPIQSNPTNVLLCESRSIRETAADLQASPVTQVQPSIQPAITRHTS